MTELMTKCVNAHDRCDGGPCPYCEPVVPLRTDDGRFADARAVAAALIDAASKAEGK